MGEGLNQPHPPQYGKGDNNNWIIASSILLRQNNKFNVSSFATEEKQQSCERLAIIAAFTGVLNSIVKSFMVIKT